VSAWSWRLAGFVPAEEGRRESLCTLGNGYVPTRAAMGQGRSP
jgi:trehalose/maltose hydrolase-like predicted phosphorylase